jgi:predicted  nucleic acid-binding Zn-ribbon protein
VNKNAAFTAAAVMTGLLGVSFMTQMDMTQMDRNLPILITGAICVIFTGVFTFLTVRGIIKSAQDSRKAMLESFPLNDMRSAQDSIRAILEGFPLNDIQSALLSVSAWLQSLRAAVLEQTAFLTAQSEINRSFFANSETNMLEIQKSLNAVPDRICDGLNEAVDKSSVFMREAALKPAQMVIEQIKTESGKQEEAAAEIIDILNDTAKSLKETVESQTADMQDMADSFKGRMKSVNEALMDLQSAIEETQRETAGEIIKLSGAYKEFEVLIKAVVDQMTTVSNQDIELLKKIISNE